MNRRERRAKLTQLHSRLDELGRTEWADRRKQYLESEPAEDQDGVWLDWADTGDEEVLLFEEWVIGVDSDGSFGAMHIEPENPYNMLKDLRRLATVDQVIQELNS